MLKSNLVRALTQDGSAMIVAADTSQIVQTAHEIHGLSKTMTEEEKQSVTLRFCGDGPAGTICCVSDWRGNVRGYADHPEAELPPNAKGKLDVGGAVGRGQMHVLRDLGLDMPYVGVASIVSGEIAEDVTNYFASSEQTPSVCALGVLVHPDFNCPTETGFIPDSGAIAAAITASTGVAPRYFGKPYADTAEMILSYTGVGAKDACVFGDRLYTDIALGKNSGMTSVLVLSGETKREDLDGLPEDKMPDMVIESIEDLTVPGRI